MKYEDLKPETQKKLQAFANANKVKLGADDLEAISGGGTAPNPEELWKIHAPMRYAAQMEEAGGVCPNCNQTFDIYKGSDDPFTLSYYHVFDCLQK